MIKLSTKRPWKGDKNKNKQGWDKVRSGPDRGHLYDDAENTQDELLDRDVTHVRLMTVTKQKQENERKHTETENNFV